MTERGVEWFAALTEDERLEVMGRGRLIQTLDDLEDTEGLTAEQYQRLRTTIEQSEPI